MLSNRFGMVGGFYCIWLHNFVKTRTTRVSFKVMERIHVFQCYLLDHISNGNFSKEAPLSDSDLFGDFRRHSIQCLSLDVYLVISLELSGHFSTTDKQQINQNKMEKNRQFYRDWTNNPHVCYFSRNGVAKGK